MAVSMTIWKAESCPHATFGKISDEPELFAAKCGIVNGLVGMGCGHSASACEACQYDKGDDTVCRTLAKRHLENLISNGNQPKFANAVDLTKLSEKYISVSVAEDRIRLVADMASQLTQAEALTAEDILAQLELADTGLGSEAISIALGGHSAMTNEEKLERVREMQDNSGQRRTCINEGEHLRYETEGCCDTVRVFDCKFFREERMSDYCLLCPEYVAKPPAYDWGGVALVP